MVKNLKMLIPEKWNMDGGVSFGVVPKGIWSALYPVNSDNTLPIVNRCLLIETESQLILVNAGYGNKRNEKYYAFKFIDERISLEECIKNAGYSTDDVTDVLFTHLHDDHCGGATHHNADGQSVPIFKNARFLISEDQWNWALHPNAREAASYFSDNLLPLQYSERLHLLEKHEQPFIDSGIVLLYVNGHTKGQVIPQFDFQGRTLVYMSDFIPSSVHIPLPYIASVDVFPMISLEEKEHFLKEAAEKQFVLVFEHDKFSEACSVVRTEKGFATGEKGDLSLFLSK